MGTRSGWGRVAPSLTLLVGCSLAIDEYVFPSTDSGVERERERDAAPWVESADASRDAAPPPAPPNPVGTEVACADAEATDVPGDCRQRRCNALGVVEEVTDDRDEPVDPGGGCSRPSCSGGAVVLVPREEGIRCGEDATECSDVDRCDGAGTCLPNHRTGLVLRAATSADCRTRICDELGVAVEVPTATACDDGLYCTGAETCTGDGTCASAGNPCPSAGASCDDACDESAGTCTGNDPRGTSCGSGVCDGAGACRECLELGPDARCSEPLPVCSSVGACVECIADGDCAGRVTLATCFRAACVDSACTSVPNVGAPCGSPADTECDNPDSCGPSGECLPNYRGSGSCGEPGRGCSCDNNGPTCRC